MEAHFEFVVVLTYAFPQELLKPLLPPGLTLDSYCDNGFVAIACVQTRSMRPKGWPKFTGQDFFLTGYRIFTRFRTAEGRNLRGLRILRSDADAETMVLAGNLLTQYHYHYSRVAIARDKQTLKLAVTSSDRSGDLIVNARLDSAQPINPNSNTNLPDGSPFKTVREALKFAGPLPFTFDYEPQTDSIIRIEGVRQEWHPQPVQVEVQQCSFFDREPFNAVKPVLCSAFFIEDVPYYWKAGISEKLTANHRSNSAPDNEDTGDFDSN